MTCTNTEKQLFTMDYTLSVLNNALDCRGHQMGARFGDHPRGGAHPYMRLAHAYACRGGVLFEQATHVLYVARASQNRMGLDLVCHLTMTCTNTKKQLFPVAYPR